MNLKKLYLALLVAIVLLPDLYAVPVFAQELEQDLALHALYLPVMLGGEPSETPARNEEEAVKAAQATQLTTSVYLPLVQGIVADNAQNGATGDGDLLVEAALYGGLYYGQHEYRVSPSSAACGGLIALRLAPENSRTNTAQLRFTVSKCNGSKFGQGGSFHILLDGKRKWGPYTYDAGITTYTATIRPLRDYNIDREHAYQIQLYSNDDRNNAKLSGVVKASAWGRCWCTDYVYQALQLAGTYGNAITWDPYLTGQGFRKLQTTRTPYETPRAGDVVLIKEGFGGVGSAGHVGVIESFDGQTWKMTLRQGGSAADTAPYRWQNDSYCYNMRSVPYPASIKNSSLVAVYRR